MKRLCLLIVCVLTLGAGSASAQGTRPTSPSSLAVAVDRLAAEEFAPDRPGGALIVVKDGKTLLRKGYGLADLELKVPVRPEMVFRVGSVTKQFTAALVMTLVEEGKIGLADDITKYLPDYPTRGKRITIEHLLTHTSGIKDYTRVPPIMADANDDKSPTEVITAFRSLPLDFEPGQRMGYTNSGYFVLGAICEKVTGRRYADLVQERIFKPAGMAHSAYIDNARILSGRARGYQETKAGVVNARYYSTALPFAAGGLESTVDDLASWDAALSSDRLLEKESRERMLASGRLANGEATGYGFGWYSYQYDGLRIQDHGGVIFGFIAYVLRVPEQHLYVALLTNAQLAKAEPFLFARKVALAALGRPLRDPLVTAAAPADIDACLGHYETADRTPVDFAKNGDHLTMKLGRGDPTEILPSAAGFFQRGTFVRVAFEKDAAGRIHGGTVTDWNSTTRFKRQPVILVARARCGAGPDPCGAGLWPAISRARCSAGLPASARPVHRSPQGEGGSASARLAVARRAKAAGPRASANGGLHLADVTAWLLAVLPTWPTAVMSVSTAIC